MSRLLNKTVFSYVLQKKYLSNIAFVEMNVPRISRNLRSFLNKCLLNRNVVAQIKKKTSQIEAKKLIRKQSLFMPLRYNGAVT